MSSPQVTPITGLPQASGWAQVITHPSRLLTCVLSVAGKNANSVGKTLAEHVSHFQAKTSAELHNALLDLLQIARQEECQIQLACILFTEDRNILATHSGSVFLQRNHKAGEILRSDNELRIIEGPRVKDDLFVLATKQSATTFPALKNMLHKPSENIVPKLVAELHGKESSALSAMAWIENGAELEAVGDDEEKQPLGKKLLGTVSLDKAANAVRSFPISRLRKNPILLAKRAARKGINFFKNLRQPRINTLGDNGNGRNRWFFIAAAVVILVLGGVIGWKQYQINQELETLQPRLGELQMQLEAARDKADTEPLVARAEVREVLRGLEDLIAANQDKQQAVKKLKEEYQLAQAFADSISGTENLDNLEPFFDLRLAEAGFIASDAQTNDEQLIALDASAGKTVVLNLENKQTSPVSLGDIGSTKAMTIEEDQLYLLAGGLHAYDLGNDNLHTQLKEQGDSDRAGSLLESFGTYLYVFNAEERNVYRYLRSDDELSDPIGWLVDKQDFVFDEIEDMAVDGDIWFTTQNGEVWRYTQGSRQEFAIQDLNTAFDSSLKIATHLESEYLYVLESSKNRLVVLRKDGTFFKEIVSEVLAGANTLAASKTEDVVYVISGSLVYRLSL